MTKNLKRAVKTALENGARPKPAPLEHTPGPWTVLPKQSDWGETIAICREDGGIIAEIPPDDKGEFTGSFPREQDEANAALLAASPDLLAACRKIIADWARGNLTEAGKACAAAVRLYEEGRGPVAADREFKRRTKA